MALYTSERLKTRFVLVYGNTNNRCLFCVWVIQDCFLRACNHTSISDFFPQEIYVGNNARKRFILNNLAITVLYTEVRRLKRRYCQLRFLSKRIQAYNQQLPEITLPMPTNTNTIAWRRATLFLRCTLKSSFFFNTFFSVSFKSN